MSPSRHFAAAQQSIALGGKAHTHWQQEPIINEAFMPSAEALAHARSIVEAFAQNPGDGVVGIGGVMYDRPHLARAKRPPLAQAT